MTVLKFWFFSLLHWEEQTEQWYKTRILDGAKTPTLRLSENFLFTYRETEQI